MIQNIPSITAGWLTLHRIERRPARITALRMAKHLSRCPPQRPGLIAMLLQYL